MKKLNLLWQGFLSSAERFAGRPALWVEGKSLNYDELSSLSKSIARTIQKRKKHDSTARTAVFAYRSRTAFAGVLGSLMAGNTYVPLNPRFPGNRNNIMLKEADCDSMIVDERCTALLGDVLESGENSMVILLPDIDDVSALCSRWPEHTFIGAQDLLPPRDWAAPTVDVNSTAYLLFTSGSTGIPKGVMISHGNAVSFLDYAAARYEITEYDRLSQMFDMTFDLSVFDMFAAWNSGAQLCCPSEKALAMPGKFIKSRELTMWFSVPSTSFYMKRFGLLKPDSYPSLRWALFCGEPLPVESLSSWEMAAPNAAIENLYGPTELTIACTSYRWEGAGSLKECELGIVPIGQPFPHMKTLIVDESFFEVNPGETGELLMNGTQMGLGYWKDEEKTRAAYITPPGKNEIFYRTGDRVRKPSVGAPMTHLGRIDFQIKVNGHRVELGEIESVVREESGLDGVVALGWPITASGASAIEVFVEGEIKEPERLKQQVALRIPDYMSPRQIHALDAIPLNSNNKFDRNRLLSMLKQGL